MNRTEAPRAVSVRRAGVVALIVAVAAIVGVRHRGRRCTDDLPHTDRGSCTRLHRRAAPRRSPRSTPVYYERYMIDKHNKPPQIQQATNDKIHWFLSLGLRRIAEPTPNNMYYQRRRPVVAGVAEPHEDLLQQQRRCRQRNRPLR